MVFSREEAVEMECPFRSPTDRQSQCISNSCPLWRWVYAIIPGEDGDSMDRRGYCGIAGKPEVFK
jgi:hypothetical protein